MITKSDEYSSYIKEHNYSTVEQTLYRFPNNYGASVIYGTTPMFGNPTYGVEVAVIKWNGNDWEIDYTTPITDDIVPYVEDLDSVLGEIYDLPEDLELEE